MYIILFTPSVDFPIRIQLTPQLYPVSIEQLTTHFMKTNNFIRSFYTCVSVRLIKVIRDGVGLAVCVFNIGGKALSCLTKIYFFYITASID